MRLARVEAEYVRVESKRGRHVEAWPTRRAVCRGGAHAGEAIAVPPHQDTTYEAGSASRRSTHGRSTLGAATPRLGLQGRHCVEVEPVLARLPRCCHTEAWPRRRAAHRGEVHAGEVDVGPPC